MSQTDVLLSLLKEDVRSLRIGSPFGDAGSGESWLSFDIRARSSRDALNYAQSLVSAVRKEAGLLNDPLNVEWVAAVPDAPDGGMRFFEQARELFDSEMYELSVVAAQIHFEVHVTHLLSQASEKRSGRWAHYLLGHRDSTNLGRDLGQAVIELLLGVQPNQLAEWEPFLAHTRRRNSVVHAGAVVDRDEAAASLDAVHSLWLVLNQAAQS